MNNEVVVYHNALNKVPFSKLNDIERSIVMIMLCQVKEKGSEVISFPIDVIKKHIKGDYSNQALKEILTGLKDHFFNLHFDVIRDIDHRYQAIDTHHLFNKFTLITDKEREDAVIKVELQVNPPFLYIVNNLIKNFTSFELVEFCSIRGKYAKDLYRLLKQYRTTGKALFNWLEFKEQMNFPAKASVRDIDTILEKAIKELTRPLDLMDRASGKQPFTNLKLKKAYDKKKRGSPITTITFTFDHQLPNKKAYEKIKNSQLI